MAKIICAVICGILALISLAIGIISFLEKGFLFNNAYIFASRQEREKMDKKPHYRQSAIVFTLISLVFACITIIILFSAKYLWIGVILLCIEIIAYALKSSTK